MIFYTQPVYEGRWRLGGEFGLSLYLEKKPCWIHRFFMKLLLGIEWIDT